MVELDKDRTRGWSWPAYLFVLVVAGGFTIVVWPVVKEQISARFAKPDPAQPPAGVRPPAGPPPTGGQPPAPAPREAAPPKAPPVAPNPESLKFRDVVVEEPFGQVFARKPTLMDTPQVHEFKLPDGRVGVVCVVQAKLHADTAAGRVEATQVCQNKMAAALLAWQKGLGTDTADKVTLPTDEIDAKIQTTMRGHVRLLPPVGRWSSGPGDVFYMAYGQVFVPGELKP